MLTEFAASVSLMVLESKSVAALSHEQRNAFFAALACADSADDLSPEHREILTKAQAEQSQ